MRKLLLTLIVALLLTACGNVASKEAATEANAQGTNLSADETVAESVGETTEIAEKALPVLETVNKMTEVNKGFNPAVDFKYVGEDKILRAVTEEMVVSAKELYNTEGAVEIPTPYVVDVDESNKEDIKVYGDFWTFGYKLDGTVFYNVNGGSMPGCYHLKEEEDGNITFVSKEKALDGSGFTSSLLDICGGNQELFDKITKRDETIFEIMRLAYVNMYAETSGVRISGIKDYGWPIMLFNNVSDAEFLYNFYHSYFEEVMDENVLNDLDERIHRLIEKYAIESLREKIELETRERGADFVIKAQDVTSAMLDSLQVDDYGNGDMVVRYAANKGEVTEINVKVENHDGKKVITDINY